MVNLKHSLLTATIFAGVAANPVLADTSTLPAAATAQQIGQIQAPGLPVSTQTVNGSSVSYDGDTALHGAGATSVQNVLVRGLNCLGTPNKLGNGQPGAAGSSAVGSLGAKAPGVYAGTPSLTCNNTSSNVSFSGGSSTYEVQPQVSSNPGYGFQGKYVGTGSGFGRKAWFYFADVFDGGSSSHAVTGVANPFTTSANPTPDNRWSHVQFALSDAPISSGDLANYNTNGNAVTFAGPAVQFPLFVLPVAIAYDTQYGVNKAGKALVFNAQYSAAYSNGSTIASLRLNAAAYCGIFNGSITNWNDPILKALNKKVALFDPTNDTATRWTNDGAPIRLVGRLDNSGTTDVFTRHLAAVCSNSAIYTGTNKYLNHAESLPYNASTNGGVDYTTVRSDTNYKPSSPASKFAGTTNTITGDYFNGSAIVNLGTGGSAAPTGYTGSGLFIVTNGGGNLAKLLTLADDLVEPDGVTLNGKIGYISADFVQPSVDSSAGLVAALLGVGSGAAPTVFDAPTIKNGLTAFGSILPPQTASGTTGAYQASDDRTLPSGDGSTTRDNPLAWTDVLYTTSTSQTYSLAAPTVGYPITGTTQFFGYTCYATLGNREAIAQLLGTSLGKITKDQTGTAIAKGFLNATTAATPGIYDQSNIGILPAAWQAAITNTFLSSTSDVNTTLTTPLYIATGLVNKAGSSSTGTGAKKVTTYTLTQPSANPACSGLQGA